MRGYLPIPCRVPTPRALPVIIFAWRHVARAWGTRILGDSAEVVGALSCFCLVAEEGWSAVPNQLRWYAKRLVELMRLLLRTARQQGVGAALEQGTSMVRSRKAKQLLRDYPRWFNNHLALRLASARSLETGPTFSVIVPVFRPVVDQLRSCIESVRSQTYDRWELLLVDDHSGDARVTAVLAKAADDDPRITHITLPENQGIAMATQAGLEIASGDFACFLDHDDLLTTDALALAAGRVHEDPSIDFLYGDEDKILPNGKLGEPSFRPDRNEDLLLAYNFVSHPIAVRTALIRSIGGIRAGFDGSQDHDLALRLADNRAKFAHLPAIVYHWRASPVSAAGSLHAKPYAFDSGRRAVEESLQRRGISATVRLGRVPGHYEVLFNPPEQANLAIIVSSTQSPKKILDNLRYVIDPDLRGLKIKVLIVQPAWRKDGSRPKSKWPQAWHQVDGEILTYVGWPNTAAALNRGASQAEGADALLFVEDDVRIVNPRVLQQLLGGLLRHEVGVVGALELASDNTIRQSGIIVHDGKIDYAYPGESLDHTGHHDLSRRMRNVSAVSASFLMTKRESFLAVGGFPEEFPNVYFDVIYCDRILRLGQRVVVDPTFPVLKAGAGRLARAVEEASDYERIAIAGFLVDAAGRPDPFFAHGDLALIPPTPRRER